MKKIVISFLIMSGFYNVMPLIASQANPNSLAALDTSIEALEGELTQLKNAIGPDGKITFATTPVTKKLPLAPVGPVSQPQVESSAQKDTETAMMALAKPFYQLPSGSNNLTDQNPTSLTSDVVSQYQTLFSQYTKTYGTSTAQYSLFKFGSLFLPVLYAKNAFNQSLQALPGNVSIDALAAADITPSMLVHASSFKDVYQPFKLYLKSLPTSFVFPVLPVLLADCAKFDTYADKVLILKKQVLNRMSAQKDAETAMMALANPFYEALSGSNSVTAQDPNSLTSGVVTQYQTLFSQYIKNYGTSTVQYLLLEFGSLFLPLLYAKNILNKDLQGLPAYLSIDALTAANITPSMLAHASSFEEAYQSFESYINSLPASFVAPFPLALLVGYTRFDSYAAKILSFKEQVLHPPVITTADKYILAHFGDAQLSVLDPSQLDPSNPQNLLAAFRKTYTSADTYYNAYQAWAAYVPLRYRELQFLNALKSSTEICDSRVLAQAKIYLRSFPALFASFQQTQNGLNEPYATQFSDLIQEFQVVYQLARMERVEQASCSNQ